MKQALLIVSFGTSVPEARGSISAVEEALAATLPGAEVCTAITSPTIRRILKGRGQQALSLEEALEKLVPMQPEKLIIQPTHMLGGVEYDKICRTVAEYSGRFAAVTLGRPLLHDTADLRILAACIAERYAGEPDALVLMGHGTSHPANLVYPAFQTALRLSGRSNAYVGTVEGWPTIDEVIGELKAAGEKDVLLAPLMLVAGDHACNDMAGDGPDSWKSKLEAEGFRVRCHMEGLGELPGVRELYCRHLREAAGV